MKFTLIVAAIAISLSTASPTIDMDSEIIFAKTEFSCHIGDPANINKPVMHDCLFKYRNGTISPFLFRFQHGTVQLITSFFMLDNWDGKDCGGRGWYKGHSNWNSPWDCYDACADCISEGINKGANLVSCKKTLGVAQCWMGYH